MQDHAPQGIASEPSIGFDCQSCGACCAYSDTWPEFDDNDTCDGIPEELCDCDTGRMRCIGNRCIALIGQLGVHVSCTIYANRPNVCREFEPGSAECRRVRKTLGEAL